MPMCRYAGAVRLGPRPSMRTGDAMRCVFPLRFVGLLSRVCMPCLEAQDLMVVSRVSEAAE